MKRVLLRSRVLPLALALVAVAPAALARQDVNRPAAGGRTQSGNRVNDVKCLVSSSKAELDINNVRAMVLNGGDMWWNLNDARYEVPKVLDPNAPRRHSIFAGAIWVGGIDPANQLYVAAQTYRQGGPPDAGFWPGPLNDTNPATAPDGEITEQICNDWNSHAKINRTEIDAFRGKAFPLSDPNEIPQSIKDWPGTGNPYLSREAINVSPLAPFVDVNNDGIYDPLTGDYPDIRGDQAIWWVMNDKGNVKEPFTPAIGLELAVQAFAFQTNDLLNNMTFYKQRIANKSNKTLLKTYLGQWVDPDLGYFNDDYVGCDVSRGLGICYNGDNLDEGVSGYGANPPAVGVDFFEGPLADANDSIDNDRDSWTLDGFQAGNVDEAGEKIIMSNFVYYNNDFSPNGNPTAAQHYYNYLRSKIKDGRDLKFGGDGVATAGTTLDNYAFMFAGATGQSDPLGYGYGNKYTDASKNVLANNSNLGDNGHPPCLWSENNTDCAGRKNTPADRRFLQSAGPFTLRPGAVNNITIGVIWAAAGLGGAQGSLALLTYADTQAQLAFDKNFEIADGPPAPKVEKTELDQQVVLSIQPSEVCVPGVGCYTTETYHAIDSALVKAGARDGFYNFEGYLIYQLANSEVTAADVNDLNKARLVARGDIVNGVGQIINYDFDVSVNQIVPQVKVNGENADQGIFHTVNITNDQFADGNSRLVNFRQYTFIVIPYAYNADTTSKDGQKIVQKPYLEGRFATKLTVIPHKVLPERNGTVLNANVYDQVPITRILGTGTGGNVIDITPADEEKIVAEGSKLELNYQVGKSPLNVRVYDPKLAKDGKFRVKLSTRLTYLASSLQGDWEMRPGDRLVSLGQYRRPETVRTGNNFYKIDNGAAPQVPGVALVNRVVAVEPFRLNDSTVTQRVTLDIEMLNDDHGGNFMANAFHYKRGATANETLFSDLTLLGYEIEPRDFQNTRTGARAKAEQFNLNDYWKWQVNGGNWTNVVRRASEVNEELIPDYGLSIQVKSGNNPGFQPKLNAQTQFLEATLTHTGTTWLTGVPYEQLPPTTSFYGIPWLLPNKIQGAGATTEEWDPSGTYSNILPIDLGPIKFGGTWAAYANTLPVNSNGAGYVVGAAKRLHNLRNVDIVFTSDKSKWTRTVVLQINLSGNPGYLLTKKGSTKPSIDKDGNPTGENSPYTANGVIPSTGVGWFPGYAVDLDRGVRLNMMFAESSASLENGGQGDDKGTDLKWEPLADKFAGRNFVYVMDTQYDEARKMERAQDSVATMPLGQIRLAYKTLYDQIMYVGYPRMVNGKTINEGGSAARVRIRVDRAFTSYPSTDTTAGPNKNPEYGFSLQGQAVDTMQTKKACDGLSLVRVVPNPYYAFSQYEQRQLDNIAKVTNLPRRVDVTIYTLNGTLVRRLRKDDNNTFIDFNMKNDSGLPIASGVYLFHISAPDLGCETVVKWFGVMRPIDLDTF